MKILTAYERTPIPLRQFDWSAWDDDRGEDWGVGWGRTEEEAIAEFMTMVEERDEDE